MPLEADSAIAIAGDARGWNALMVMILAQSWTALQARPAARRTGCARSRPSSLSFRPPTSGSRLIQGCAKGRMTKPAPRRLGARAPAAPRISTDRHGRRRRRRPQAELVADTQRAHAGYAVGAVGAGAPSSRHMMCRGQVGPPQSRNSCGRRRRVPSGRNALLVGLLSSMRANTFGKLEPRNIPNILHHQRAAQVWLARCRICGMDSA